MTLNTVSLRLLSAAKSVVSLSNNGSNCTSGVNSLLASHSDLSSRKAWLLGLLTLFQTVPRGFLSCLPILLREQKASLQQLATLSLCTAPDLLKPVFAWALDMPLLAGHRAAALLGLQLCTIALFAHFSTLAVPPSFRSLLLLFSLSHLLTAVHDAAADGLAVALLSPSEQAAGALAQYA
eukprot:gene45260-55369_t